MTEVFICTAVPPEFMGIRAQRIMEEFPEIPADHIYMGARKDNIHTDIMFDDAMHNILNSSAKYPVLMRRPWNQEATGMLAVNYYDEFLKIVEIIAENGWYGYDEKYRSDKTQYRFLEDGELSRRVKETAVTAYRAFGCRGVTRIDFMVSPLGRCYVLELNTSPGFTSHSLVPMAGMHAGLTFAGVCERILRSADYDR
jgi:hypothetical protein